MLTLFLVLLCLYGANGATHSFRAFYTATTGISSFPEFTAIGQVDGVLTAYYDSFTKQTVPRTDWMKNSEGPDYWKQQTDIIVGTEQTYKNNIQVVMERFNQSGGVHTLQVMYGCEIEDDGITRGNYQFGYDGVDFISFDKNTLTWTAANPKAVISKNKLDPNTAHSNQWKGYLENICIESLNKYVGYGKEILERKVPPTVSLLLKDSSPVVCHATGFYPNNIMMAWKKNNEDLYEDVEVSSTLPNEDGSYQKSISLSVNSDEWKKNPDIYRCVIQHVGAEKEIVLLLNENNIKTNTESSNNMIAIIVGCFVALALLAAIIGFIVWKKSNGYKKANASDTDSENSGQQLPQAT